MKQNLLKSMLLLCAFIVGSAVWADEVTSKLTFTAACGGSGKADNGIEWTVTSDGEESVYDGTKGIHYGTGSKAVQYIQLATDEISGTITKVVVNASTASGVTASVDVTVGGAAFGGDAQALSSDAKDYTFSGSAEGAIVVKVAKPESAAKALYVKSVEVTYTTGSSDPTKVATPIISGKDNFYPSTEISISCATEGATISYILSNSSGVTTHTYTGPFTITETTLVRATAAKQGMVTSDEAVKAFTKTDPLPNIGSIRGSVIHEYVQLTDALVTYKNGINAYLEDYSGAIMLYGCVDDLEAGDKLTGMMHITDYTVHNGLPEIKAFEMMEGYEKTSGNEVTPTEMTLAQLLFEDAADPYEFKLSKYIKIVDATVISAFANRSCTIQQGEYSIVLWDQNNPGVLSSKKDDVVTVTGHVSIYNTTKQIAVYEQSQIEVAPAPVIPTIAETRAMDLNTEVYTQGIVTSSDVGPKYTTAYIQDETAAICVYALNESAENLVVGNKINVRGTLKNYQYLLRIESPTEITVVSTENSVTPELITIPEIYADYESTNKKQGILVKIEKALVTARYELQGGVTNAAIQQGEKSLMVDALSGNLAYEVGDEMSLIGNVSVAGTLRIANATNVVVKKPSVDYATLPFEWAGGPSADFNELNGVTTDGLGSDYAEGNKPYLIKLDGTGDYIQVKTDSQPGTVTIGVKMIGGANDSKITVQESADGETFTDVEELTISGAQNAILELATTNAFATNSRYVRLTFTKGSNVGVGPISISKAAAPSTEPSIAVSTTNVNVLAAGEEGTIKVTYNNITDVVAEVVFCNSIGEEAAYDWITAEINESNNIDYLVEANTVPEARTAYLKVHALDDDANDVYSEIITIIQNRYVVDYATLPFEFDGGKADIAAITGLTQDGLDSDYGSSPKLKFNGSGDEVVLKINEVPGTLFFDIKGNSFSGGTFTVQTSANGKTYTDLATYTELGSTTQTESFELDADVRYIKWVYTEKVTGNVALGNIKLTNGSVITISESLYATYCNPTKALSFTGSGVTAYVVRLVQDYTAYIEEVPEVPANTPIIVRADAAGSYDVTITESADAVGTNMLKVSDGTIIGGDGIYALADKGNGVGFYPVPTSITIPNGKCYLDTNSTGTKAFLGFGEFETAIKNVIVNENENAIYNIAGQRMSKMQKGVNIVNGKKVLK